MQTGSLDRLEADRLELAADTIGARADTENFPVALRILSAEQRRHLMAIRITSYNVCYTKLLRCSR